jgi:hypothetical protein
VKKFKNGQRVKVVNKELLNGKTGTVFWAMGGCAWITMDDPLPESLVTFPASDHRHKNIELSGDECELLS